MALRDARLQGERQLAGAAAAAPGAQHRAEQVGLGAREAEGLLIMDRTLAPARGPADYLPRN